MVIKDMHDQIAKKHPSYQKTISLILGIIVSQDWKRWFDIIFRAATFVNISKLHKINIISY